MSGANTPERFWSKYDGLTKVQVSPERRSQRSAAACGSTGTRPVPCTDSSTTCFKPWRWAKVDVLDDAFLRLRRLWSPSRQRLVDEGGVVVEMSSLLVVEACARGAAAGREVSVADVALLADVAPSTASRLVDRAACAGLVDRGTSRVARLLARFADTLEPDGDTRSRSAPPGGAAPHAGR